MTYLTLDRPALALAAALAALAGCAPGVPVPVVENLEPSVTLAPIEPLATPVRATPASVNMRASLPGTVDSIISTALADRLAPGAAVAIGRHGRIVHMRGYGMLDWTPDSAALAAVALQAAGNDSNAPAGSGSLLAPGPVFADSVPVTEATLFDVASLTKVVATTTAAMILEDRGLLALDSTVGHYLPRFVERDSAKRLITVRHLLTHRGGLEAYAPLYLDTLVRGRERYLERIAERPLRSAPGTSTVYSDWDMILLQLIVEKVAGSPLEWFFEDHVAQPLGLRETLFRPAAPLLPRTAVTAHDSTRGGLLRGTVHDGNAWAIGGVSGHAGLFSSARDLAAFAHMMLSDGRLGATALVEPATVARWTAPQVDGSSRALGWDTPSGDRSSAGRYFSQRSFGHTGFTGTSLWIDPEKGVFVVLLTNRVHSAGTTPAGRVLDLRAAVADAVQESILDAPVVRWR